MPLSSSSSAMRRPTVDRMIAQSAKLTDSAAYFLSPEQHERMVREFLA